MVTRSEIIVSTSLLVSTRREKNRRWVSLKLSRRKVEFFHLLFTPQQLLFTDLPHPQNPCCQFDVNGCKQELHTFPCLRPRLLSQPICLLGKLLRFHPLLQKRDLNLIGHQTKHIYTLFSKTIIPFRQMTEPVAKGLQNSYWGSLSGSLYGNFKQQLIAFAIKKKHLGTRWVR